MENAYKVCCDNKISEDTHQETYSIDIYPLIQSIAHFHPSSLILQSTSKYISEIPAHSSSDPFIVLIPLSDTDINDYKYIDAWLNLYIQLLKKCHHFNTNLDGLCTQCYMLFDSNYHNQIKVSELFYSLAEIFQNDTYNYISKDFLTAFSKNVNNETEKIVFDRMTYVITQLISIDCDFILDFYSNVLKTNLCSRQVFYSLGNSILLHNSDTIEFIITKDIFDKIGFAGVEAFSSLLCLLTNAIKIKKDIIELIQRNYIISVCLMLAYTNNKIRHCFPHEQFLRFCLDIIPYFNKETQEDIDFSFYRYLREVCSLSNLSIKIPVILLIEQLDSLGYIPVTDIVDKVIINLLCNCVMDDFSEDNIFIILKFIHKSILDLQACNESPDITKNDFNYDFIEYLKSIIENETLQEVANALLALLDNLPISESKYETSTMNQNEHADDDSGHIYTDDSYVIEEDEEEYFEYSDYD